MKDGLISPEGIPSDPTGVGRDSSFRVAICRAETPGRPAEGPRADPLEVGLRSVGAQVKTFPLASIVAPRDPGPLLRGARGLLGGAFDVVLLTSPRAVGALQGALDSLQRGSGGAGPGEGGGPGSSTEASGLHGVEGWVVGSSTASAAESLGLGRIRTPERFVAEGLLKASQGWSPRGRRIFFPRAAEGRDLLPQGLVEQGAEVTMVEAYRSVPDLEGARALVAEARGGLLSGVALTAGSQARVLGRVLAEEGERWIPESHGFFVAIGPATRGAMLSVGLPEPVVADPHTFQGVVAAVAAEWLRVRRGPS